jgi:hypothetical protein
MAEQIVGPEPREATSHHHCPAQLLRNAVARLLRRSALAILMSYPEIAIIVIFFVWQCSAIAFIVTWRRDAGFTVKGKLVFVAVALALLSLRVGALWYLGYRMRTHTLYEAPDVLWWLFLPDSVFLQRLHLNSPTWSTVATYSVFLLGSLAWSFPILLFMMQPKTRRATLG